MPPFRPLVFPALLPFLLVARPLSAQTPAATDSVAWLAIDSTSRTATVALTVTAPSGAPSALINGFREGGVQVVVPRGWTLAWDWHSEDAAGKHSLVVMAEREKLPAEGGQPAFTNAMTRSLTAGLPAGQADRTTFVADQTGWYWLLCGVPGHALAGEWIGLKVDGEVSRPGFVLKGR